MQLCSKDVIIQEVKEVSIMRSVFITGATKGIGYATAKKFLENGDFVFVNYCSDDVSAHVVEEEFQERFPNSFLFIKGDVSKESDVVRMSDIVQKKVEHLDVLVNNAGIAIDTTYEDKTVANFQKTLNVNLIGPFLVSKYFAPLMDVGSIINVSSTNGINTNYIESLDYDASKAGLISLTKNLSLQYAPRIRVNAVAPGWVLTPMNQNLDSEFIEEECKKTSLGRFAEPMEIANVIFFLANSEASFMTGSVVVVDGGYHG